MHTCRVARNATLILAVDDVHVEDEEAKSLRPDGLGNERLAEPPPRLELGVAIGKQRQPVEAQELHGLVDEGGSAIVQVAMHTPVLRQHFHDEPLVQRRHLLDADDVRLGGVCARDGRHVTGELVLDLRPHGRVHVVILRTDVECRDRQCRLTEHISATSIKPDIEEKQPMQ